MLAMIIFLKSSELSLRKQVLFLFKFTFALRSEIIAKLWGQHVEQTKVSFRVRNRLFHGLTFPQQPLWRARSHHAFDFGRQTPEVEKNSLLCKKDFFLSEQLFRLPLSHFFSHTHAHTHTHSHPHSCTYTHARTHTHTRKAAHPLRSVFRYSQRTSCRRYPTTRPTFSQSTRTTTTTSTMTSTTTSTTTTTPWKNRIRHRPTQDDQLRDGLWQNGFISSCHNYRK